MLVLVVSFGSLRFGMVVLGLFVFGMLLAGVLFALVGVRLRVVLAVFVFLCVLVAFLVGVLAFVFVVLIRVRRAGFVVFFFRAVLGYQIEAFHVDEHGPIVGRAGRFEHADDRERFFVHVGFRAAAVRGLELVAHFQARLPRHGGADHRAKEFVRLEIAARGKLYLLPP